MLIEKYVVFGKAQHKKRLLYDVMQIILRPESSMQKGFRKKRFLVPSSLLLGSFVCILIYNKLVILIKKESTRIRKMEFTFITIIIKAWMDVIALKYIELKMLPINIDTAILIFNACIRKKVYWIKKQNS